MPPKSKKGKKKKDKAQEEAERLKREEEERKARELQLKLEEEERRKLAELERQRQEELKKKRDEELERLNAEKDATEEELRSLEKDIDSMVLEKREEEEWNRYIECSELPDVRVEREVNTFTSELLEEQTEDLQHLLERVCDRVESVVSDLEREMMRAHAKRDYTQVEKYMMMMHQLHRTSHWKLDVSTAHLLQYSDRYQTVIEARPEARVEARRELRIALHSPSVAVRVGLWANLEFKAPPRKQVIPFEELSLQAILGEEKSEHSSQTPRNATSKVPPIGSMSDLFRTRTMSSISLLNTLGTSTSNALGNAGSLNIGGSNKCPTVEIPRHLNQSSAGKMAVRLCIFAFDPFADISTTNSDAVKSARPQTWPQPPDHLASAPSRLSGYVVHSQNRPRSGLSSTSRPSTHNNRAQTAEEVPNKALEDLTAYDVALGSVYLVQLLSLPVPAKHRKGWTIRTVTELALSVQPFNETQTVSGAAIPIRISVPVSRQLLLPQQPRVGWWDDEKCFWSEEGITEISLDPPSTENLFERMLQFMTTHYGYLAVLHDRTEDLPFQAWDIKPTGKSSALLSLACSRFPVEIEIGEGVATLKRPDLPELAHVRDVPMEVGVLLRVLRLTGLNLIPNDQDANQCFLEGAEDPIQIKSLELEKRVEFAVANIAPAFAISSSTWNQTVGSNRCVFRLRELLVGEPDDLPEAAQKDEGPNDPSWRSILADEEKFLVILVKEFDQQWDESPLDESHETHAFLHLSLRSAASQESLYRAQRASSLFKETLQQVLRLTRIFSFS